MRDTYIFKELIALLNVTWSQDWVYNYCQKMWSSWSTKFSTKSKFLIWTWERIVFLQEYNNECKGLQLRMRDNKIVMRQRNLWKRKINGSHTLNVLFFFFHGRGGKWGLGGGAAISCDLPKKTSLKRVR